MRDVEGFSVQCLGSQALCVFYTDFTWLCSLQGGVLGLRVPFFPKP